ncbi:MAG: winged helix DNA-binding domain-containing protein [Mycobacteriaceae bacterium]|nr:winged helix DNA-binding domain-containing protein [Mycobacteriaceae bacterium]
MVEYLVGLQAQDVLPPFVGLWNRIEGFDPAAVSAGLSDRSLARLTLMRGTIHLVTARDAVRIAPHIQPELEKVPFRKGFYFGETVGLDPEEVRAHGERLVGAEPVTTAQLRAHAARLWPDRKPAAVVQAWLYQLAVLQVPPRGMWGHNERPSWARIEPWLGLALDREYPRAELLARYLAAFGPASTMDMQTWSRFTGLKPDVDSLGDRLRRYTDERGRTLYDLADAELADPDLPAPARLLGWYDNVFLSHQDRTRIVPATSVYKPDLRAYEAPFLVDGFAAGTYRIERTSDTAQLVLRPSRALNRRESAELTAEADRLLAFVEPDRARTVVQKPPE